MTAPTLAAVLWLGLAAGARGGCPDVVARVDGRPILRCQMSLAAELTRLRRPATDVAQAERAALEGLVTREVLTREAAARRLTVDEGAIAAARQEAQRAVADEQAWAAFLDARGFDAAAFDAELRLQVLARALLVAEAEAVPPATDAEARARLGPGGEPSPAQLESARWEVTRLRRAAATRQVVESLRARAKVERYCED